MPLSSLHFSRLNRELTVPEESSTPQQSVGWVKVIVVTSSSCLAVLALAAAGAGGCATATDSVIGGTGLLARRHTNTPAAARATAMRMTGRMTATVGNEESSSDETEESSFVGFEDEAEEEQVQTANVLPPEM